MFVGAGDFGMGPSGWVGPIDLALVPSYSERVPSGRFLGLCWSRGGEDKDLFLLPSPHPPFHMVQKIWDQNDHRNGTILMTWMCERILLLLFSQKGTRDTLKKRGVEKFNMICACEVLWKAKGGPSAFFLDLCIITMRHHRKHVSIWKNGASSLTWE